MLLRNQRQQALAALHARGDELLQRYVSAAESLDLPAGLRAAFARIAAQRRELLQDIARLAREAGDLAEAGNVERAGLAAAADAASLWFGSGDDVAQRLRRADRDWLDELQRAQSLDWSSAEAAVLERLGEHLRAALQALARGA